MILKETKCQYCKVNELHWVFEVDKWYLKDRKDNYHFCDKKTKRKKKGSFYK